MTDKRKKIQPLAWFALFTLSLFASTAFGIFDLAENETLAIQVQCMSGKTGIADVNATDKTGRTDADTPRVSAVTSLVGTRATENPHIISDACLPDTLHGPPWTRITTV
ncbi:MAG: hypothetical protein LJE74_10155 [Proteobacteria bacterium]|nr:hypothetical protein [Pseudomonadota bacterium]